MCHRHCARRWRIRPTAASGKWYDRHEAGLNLFMTRTERPEPPGEHKPCQFGISCVEPDELGTGMSD